MDGAPLVADATFSSVDRDLKPGEMVGEYRIEELIGKGSFGVVYRAVHPVIGKAAAVKILKREFSADPAMASRFISEARAVNQIRHRNIVDIFSFGVFRDGHQYYVMELLEGTPFDRYLTRTGPLPPAEALPILDRIARALDAAHDAGIVHRDLKPGNVFLAVDDGGRFPKLLDFGVAKLMHEESRNDDFRTVPGVMLGTPHYMSPEQCRGDAVDHLTDVYAFGVMVHQTLTGHLPFDGDSILKVMNLHNYAAPPRMSEHNSTLPAVMDGPVLHMLQKDPAQRPRSAGEACRALIEAARASGAADPSLAPTSRGAPAATPPRVAFENDRLAATRAQGTFGAQTVSNRPPRRLVFLTTALTTAALAIIGAIAVASHLRNTSPIAPSAVPPAVVSGSRSTAPSATVPEPAADVRFSVQSTPPAAEAFLDGRSLGVSPGPLVVPRGDREITIEFKAVGYRPKRVQVTPTADGVVSVTLTPAQTSAPPRGHGKHSVDDLEF